MGQINFVKCDVTDPEAVAQAVHGSGLRPETVLAAGDKVIAIGRNDCSVALHAELIGGTPADPLASGEIV